MARGTAAAATRLPRRDKLQAADVVSVTLCCVRKSGLQRQHDLQRAALWAARHERSVDQQVAGREVGQYRVARPVVGRRRASRWRRRR